MPLAPRLAGVVCATLLTASVAVGFDINDTPPPDAPPGQPAPAPVEPAPDPKPAPEPAPAPAPEPKPVPEVTAKPAADREGPTLAITSPEAGEAVPGEVEIRGQLHDRSGVARVEVRVNGRLQQRARSPRRQFQVTADLARLQTGRHRIAVVAIDRRGNATREIVPVRLTAGVKFRARIHGVENRQVIWGQVRLAATAKPAGKLRRIVFEIDGNQVRTDFTGPYQIADNALLDTTTLRDGKHRLRVIAIDRHGRLATRSITFFVQNAAPPGGRGPGGGPSLVPIPREPGIFPTGPRVALVPPSGSGGGITALIDGKASRLETQGNGISPAAGYYRISVPSGAKRSEWLVFKSDEIRHLVGYRIGFAMDFRWLRSPSDWGIFPFQAHDSDGHGSPSFAFENGTIGTRSGSRGSGSFEHSWDFEKGGRPVIGRRYRVKGFYDYKPRGGAQLQAAVMTSDDNGRSWSPWRTFANESNLKIGFTSSGVKGIYGKGGGYHASSTLEGEIYGWAFGHETPEAAAVAAFGTP